MKLPDDPESLCNLIRNRLHGTARHEEEKELAHHSRAAVLFLLGVDEQNRPSLILTQRSMQVSQPGDICFPGGRVSPLLDSMLTLLLPLTGHEKKSQGEIPGRCVAAGLREAWEEIRLAPRRVRILGALPPRELATFKKTMQPVVAWSDQQRPFRPNYEVERILLVPLEELLKPDGYAALDLSLPGEPQLQQTPAIRQMVCFNPAEDSHYIWGATLYIILDFLKQVFDFVPPTRESLPRITRSLPDAYFS